MSIEYLGLEGRSRMRRAGPRRLSTLLVAAAVLSAGPALGQALQTGTIVGTVRDNQGGAAANGAAGFYYDYDSFEQVQISTAQHAAEVGTPGVYYNFVAKRGTDAFHGGLAYYFENDSLVSDNVTAKLRDQGIKTGAGINLFSDATAQLGGPIIKDKL